jgi:acetyl-CoA synthetase
MVPELPVTMLACGRLGVVHSQVFGGFSGNACGTRIADSGSRILITMDGYYRSGDLVDHKVKADEALAEAHRQGQEVDKVLVWRRYPDRYSSATPMTEGRDFFVDEVIGKYSGVLVEPVPMPAEAPLFLMYTSGTTGRPKGAQHSTGGYLSYVAGTSKYYQDIHPDDTYWCMADIGWITGHSYIVYGPLSLGTTSVIYEGTPNYPDAGRPWRIAEKLGVNIFHTSPTAIRMLRKVGPDEPGKYDYHFKHMTTVGEPIEPQVWRWYHEVVGKGDAVIVDTWWQTETGGFLGSTLPALNPMKPGSCGPAVIRTSASAATSSGVPPQRTPTRPAPAKPTRMPSALPARDDTHLSNERPRPAGLGRRRTRARTLPARVFPDLCRRGEAPRAKSPAFSALMPATVENPGVGLAPGFAGRAGG